MIINIYIYDEFIYIYNNYLKLIIVDMYSIFYCVHTNHIC